MVRIYSVFANGMGREGEKDEAEPPRRLNVFCRESRKSSRTLARTSRLPYVLLTDRRGLVVATEGKKISIKSCCTFGNHFRAAYLRSRCSKLVSRVSCLRSIRPGRGEFSKRPSRGQLMSVIG